MMNQWSSRFHMLAVVAIAMASMLTIADAGFAQQRGMGPWMRGGDMGRDTMRHLLQPDFHARDMSILSQQLELDHSQRPIFEMLLEDYRDAFRGAAADLERALRHQQLRIMEEQIEQRLGNLPLPNVPNRPVQLIDFDGAEVVRVSPDGLVTMQAERLTIMTSDADSTQQVPATVNVSVMFFEHGETASPADDDDGADTPSETPRTGSGQDDEGRDGQRLSRSDLPEDVRERMSRMRERIRERMEQRLEQQREEMRQRGIDPDDEMEPLEADEIAAMARTLLNDKQQLRNRFESDARILLTPLQREDLPRAFQTIRRLNALQDSQLSGEQVDLARVLDELRLTRLPESPELELLLDAYHRDLDEALNARMRFMEQADIDRYLARDADDWDELLKLADAEAKHRVAVRTVNETYAEQIADHLPSENDQQQFIAAVQERSFPQLAAATQAERLFAIVLQHDDLDPEHRETIEHLRDQHAREMAEHRRQAMATLHEHEVTRQRDMIEFRRQLSEWRARREEGGERGRPQFRPPMAEERRVRRQTMSLDQQYARQLRSAVPTGVIDQIAEGDERVHALLERFDRPTRRGGPRIHLRESGGE